jgi:cytochrome P450
MGGTAGTAKTPPSGQRMPVVEHSDLLEVTSYDDVRTVLRDSRFAVWEGLALIVQGITSGPVWDRVCDLLISNNGDQHRRLRRLVASAFTPRAVERMRTTCAEVITEIVDRHTAAGHCDVVADIARPYPVPIICAVLGAPRKDWHLFSEWADDINKVFGLRVAEDAPAILRAWEQLDAYIENLIVEHSECDSDDVYCDLIHAEDEGDRLSYDELISLAASLLNAGIDTIRGQLAAAVQALCDHPAQWALLAERPELAPRAVEELLRYAPVVATTARRATEDVEVGGRLIRAGTMISVNIASANHDPKIYDDPDRLDITRDAPPAMMTFGGGVHFCLGAHLARLELIEALRVIPRRMPNARRTGPAPWRPRIGIAGPTTLPIEFDAV